MCQKNPKEFDFCGPLMSCTESQKNIELNEGGLKHLEWENFDFCGVHTEVDHGLGKRCEREHQADPETHAQICTPTTLLNSAEC